MRKFAVAALRAQIAAALALGIFVGAVQADDTAARFVAETEKILDDLDQQANLAEWETRTNITDETRTRSNEARAAYQEALKGRVAEARNLHSDDPVIKRKLLLLRLKSAGIPSDPRLSARLLQVVAEMDDHYSNACPIVDANQPCIVREKIEAEFARARDAARLKKLWTAWYDTAGSQKKSYAEYAVLANTGARDTGYADAAVMSRALYEVDPAEFLRDMEALWEDLRPLYLLLHSHVRERLVAKYGEREVDPKGPIPIHLVGNLWGQEWDNIIDLLVPPGGNAEHNASFNNMRPKEFVSIAENFFVSLGFPALSASFWQRSFFERPRPNFDCHPSAWRFEGTDLRLKMCTEMDWANFITAHHEIGHIFYFQSFAQQPYLFRDAANEGINEAIGDAAALSVTPSYLRRIGLPDVAGDSDINSLLRVALRQLVHVPFSLMLQKWRWGVLSGDIPPERYNDAWWALVREYQGLAPPEPRSKDGFDPGAKMHIAADIDYIRYLLADVLTFQIHDALSREASCADVVHRCSIFGSHAAGKRWRNAMEMGASRPWTDVLQAMVGERRISGLPLRNYLAPLETWLKTNTAGKPIGW